MLNKIEQQALDYAIRCFKLSNIRRFDPNNDNWHIPFWLLDLKPTYELFLEFLHESSNDTADNLNTAFKVFEAVGEKEPLCNPSETIASFILWFVKSVITKTEPISEELQQRTSLNIVPDI